MNDRAVSELGYYSRFLFKTELFLSLVKTLFARSFKPFFRQDKKFPFQVAYLQMAMVSSTTYQVTKIIKNQPELNRLVYLSLLYERRNSMPRWRRTYCLLDETVL